MAYFLSLLVGFVTYWIFKFVHIKKTISNILLISKNTFQTIRSSQADDIKQKQLLQLSAKQLRLSFKILFQTIILCIPGMIFYWFYQDRFNDVLFLSITSVISLLSFLFSNFINRNEK